jgi:hypothetical protein
MAKKKDSGMVRFIVELEDGSTHLMSIDKFTLRSGDHVARIIASEHQQGGQIPPGKIKSVKRAPPSEQW